MGVILDEKYGVNPSVNVCFWCGRDIGVVLFGRMKGGKEAPRKCVIDKEPCDDCRKNMSLGITLMIANSDGPTGQYCVVTEEYIRRVINEPMQSEILKKRKAYIDMETAKNLGIME